MNAGSFHAIALLISSIGLLLPVLRYGQTENRRSVGSALTNCWPILLIAILSLLMLNIGGRPTLEWGMFLIIGMTNAMFVNDDQLRQRIRLGCLICTAGLTFSFFELVCNGEFSADTRTWESINRGRLKHSIEKAAVKLDEKFGADQEIKGPVSELLGIPISVETIKYRREWHTVFTKLSERVRVPCELMATGEFKEGKRVIEVVPRDSAGST